MTQLAKTRRVLFVEGKDFQILGKYARKLDAAAVALRRDFAVVPVEGFSPDRIRTLKAGMEATLGGKIVAASILDRDYRCSLECQVISAECGSFSEYFVIHARKEIENFLLIPSAIDRVVRRKVAERSRSLGETIKIDLTASRVLEEFAESKKNYIVSRYLENRRRFERGRSAMHEAQINEIALDEFEEMWRVPENRLALIPGKEALSEVNRQIQGHCGVSITPTAIIDAMQKSEISDEMVCLVDMLVKFSRTDPA